MAGSIGRIEDLVVEDGEIERESQTDRVGRRQLGLGDLGGILLHVLVGLARW